VEASKYAKFEQRWPAIAADLEASYRLVAEVPINEDFVTRVLVLNTRIPSRYVPFKKLPCFN
jgi:hypothetical protein